MLSKNILCSSKVTVNTVLIIFVAFSVFCCFLYIYVKSIPVTFDILLGFMGGKIINEDLSYFLVGIVWLLGACVWIGFPLAVVFYFFLKSKNVYLYPDRIYVETVGDIPLNKITSFDTPIFDYPKGHQTLHIRRKWKLPLRLAERKEEYAFDQFIYQFVDNIQKLPEHERPKFKTIHGSIIARLFGVSILVAMTIATFFALRIGHIPGTLILAWSAAIPIALLFIKGQRTP